MFVSLLSLTHTFKTGVNTIFLQIRKPRLRVRVIYLKSVELRLELRVGFTMFLTSPGTRNRDLIMWSWAFVRCPMFWSTGPSGMSIFCSTCSAFLRSLGVEGRWASRGGLPSPGNLFSPLFMEAWSEVEFAGFVDWRIWVSTVESLTDLLYSLGWGWEGSL